MIRLKDRKSLIYYTFNVCMVEPCDNTATELWSTESNVIDICNTHYMQLEAEKYKT